MKELLDKSAMEILLDGWKQVANENYNNDRNVSELINIIKPMIRSVKVDLFSEGPYLYSEIFSFKREELLFLLLRFSELEFDGRRAILRELELRAHK